MSHFTRIKTKMVNKEYLLQALADLGYPAEQGDVKIGGFLGEKTHAEIKIKVKGRDLGFRKAGPSYDIIGDFWGSGNAQQDFVRQLTQRYAYNAARAQLEAQGFSLVNEETQADGQLHLVLRRAV